MSDPAVVKFGAAWCGPCRMYAPAFERVSNTRPGVAFISVDIDEDTEAAQRFAVSSVPTTIIVKDGQEVARLSGAKSTSILTRFVDDNL